MIVTRSYQNNQVGQLVEQTFELESDVLHKLHTYGLVFIDDSNVPVAALKCDAAGLKVQNSDGAGGLLDAVALNGRPAFCKVTLSANQTSHITNNSHITFNTV